MSEAGGEAPHCYRHPARETWIRCQRCERPICPDCMRDAAVGFQCPECVNEGRKQTRQARTTYGGQRSASPHLTTLVLMGLNVAVWLVVISTGGAAGAWAQRLSLIPRGTCVLDNGQGYYPQASELACRFMDHPSHWVGGVASGDWWQLVTSMFTHVQPIHIAVNMLSLWFIGPSLEHLLGRARFLAVYLVSGLAGSVLVYLASAPDQQTLGASGAIFGIFGALLVAIHKIGGDLRTAMFVLAANFFYTFANPGISWQGHVGGFLGGLLLGAAMVYAPRRRRSAAQWGAVAGLCVVLLVLVVLRTAALTG